MVYSFFGVYSQCGQSGRLSFIRGFADPLVKLFGWKRGDISFAYSLAFLEGLPAVVIMGWLGGILFDLSGTYTWSILASVAIGYLGLPLALLLPRHKNPAASGSRDAGKR